MSVTLYFAIIGIIIVLCLIMYAIAGSNPISALYLKPIANIFLCLTLTVSGILGGLEIFQYYTATGMTFGAKPDPASNLNQMVESFTYTGEDYGFKINRITFKSIAEPVMTILYDPLEIDLTQPYGIFVNNISISNLNKSINFIEGDLLYNFYSSTNLQNAIEGRLHIKYVFNDTLTTVTLTAQTSDYDYWINFLKLNNFVITIQEYTLINNDIPFYDTSTLNVLVEDGQDSTPDWTLYINKNSPDLAQNINKYLTDYNSKDIRMYIDFQDKYDLIKYTQLTNTASSNSNFTTMTATKDPIAKANATITILIVTRKWHSSWIFWGWWDYTAEYFTVNPAGEVYNISANRNYGIVLNTVYNSGFLDGNYFEGDF